MKKYAIILGLVITCILGAQTITWNRSEPTYETPLSYEKDFGSPVDVNNQTIALPNMNGWIDAIVVDSNNTDTSYKVEILDENQIAIFSRADLTSASEPNRLSVYTTYGSSTYPGARINGTPYLRITDCNDGSMDDLDITIYYRDFRKW